MPDSFIFILVVLVVVFFLFCVFLDKVLELAARLLGKKKAKI